MASRVTDQTSIQDVMIRYALALDSRDWELLRRCFIADAQVQYPGSPLLEGFEAVWRFCDQALRRYRATQHLLGNYSIAVDNDHATTAVALQATHFAHETEGGDTFVLWGTYRDDVVRTVDGWRIARRTLTSSHTERWPGIGPSR